MELDEHRRRLETKYNPNTLPTSWEEFTSLPNLKQYELAGVLSILVEAFGYYRSDFIEIVLREFEWYLMDFWYHTCRSCRLPVSHCKNL